MSKRLLIVTLIFTFILFFNNEVKAVCDPGYTAKSVAFTYSNPTCQGTIYYCYKLDPMGVMRITIDRIEMTIPCALNITYNSQFWSAVDLCLLDDLFKALIYPPCPLQSTLAVITRVSCWKFVNDPSHQMIKLVKCETDGKCECIYKICTDLSLVVPKNIITPQGCTPIGVSDCPVGQPEMPPYLKTPFEEWETECRNLGCN